MVDHVREHEIELDHHQVQGGVIDDRLNQRPEGGGDQEEHDGGRDARQKHDPGHDAGVPQGGGRRLGGQEDDGGDQRHQRGGQAEVAAQGLIL